MYAFPCRTGCAGIALPPALRGEVGRGVKLKAMYIQKLRPPIIPPHSWGM